MEPADGAGASTSGMESAAQVSSLSRATSSRVSGGEDMARQAKLAASPHSAAISCMACSEAPANGLETTMGLRVPASMAAN